MGANTTHVFAIFKGKVDWNSLRRINVGGNNAFELFAKTVLLKNPQLKSKLNYPFLKDLYEQFTEVAIEYHEQLKYFRKSFEPPKKVTAQYVNRIHEQNKAYTEELQFIEEL